MALSDKDRGQGAVGSKSSQSTGGIQLVVCVILSVVLFTFDSVTGDDGPLATVEWGFQTITSPVRYLGDIIATPFQGLANIFTNLTADQETLSELEAENAELKAQLVELEETELTAERLQELLDLQDAYNLQSTAAQVISDSSDSWTTTITIDKGTSSGIEVGMPVTSSAGIIGQVIECSASTSTVRLLTDESSSVAVMIQSSRVQGMLTGSASGTVELTLVSTDEDVAIGDVVVTSGLGGVFPKGLPVGVVTSVEDTGSLYWTITVELYADPDATEEVLVITSLTEEQLADADDIAEADAQDQDSSADDEDEEDSDESDDSEDSDDTDDAEDTDDTDESE